MSSITVTQQAEVINELLKERFPDLNGVRVLHPRGLAPVVLAQHLVLEEAPDLAAEQVKALGDAAALLDAAQQKAREIRFLQADSLSGWHRVAQFRRLKFVSVAGRLIEAFEITKRASIVLRISAGLVSDCRAPDGGRVRYALIGAASVRHANSTPISCAASNGSAASVLSPAPAGVDARDFRHEATLIATGYLARHPEAAAEMPALIERIGGALRSCGTLPIDFDDAAQFARQLAKAMPSAPTPLARHAQVRRRVLDRKAPAGA